MILTTTYLKKNWVKLLVPIVIILLLGYYNYVINYSLGWKLIHRHHSKASAIVLWILVGFTQFTLFTYWILIFVIGPGKSPKFPPLNLYGEESDELIPLPDLFFCDESGFPYFCSNSQSIKLERSFFSKDVGYNVIKFDHYCIWIGHPIGQDNYLFFMKFMILFFSLFVISLIYVAVYTRSSIALGEIDHNFIVLYIFCGLWIMMIGSLFGIHFRYVCVNMTTLDDITRNQRKRYNRWREAQNKEKKVPEWMQPSVEPRKETGRRYVNVKLGDTRVVVKYYIDSRPFDMGLKKNWINLIFNGNRNHGLDESLYTTTRFIAALVVFWVPFIDIPLCFKNRLRNKDEVEKFSNSEMLLHKYNTYSSVVNDKFMEEMDAKIKKGEYTIPKYLEPKDSDNTL